MKKDIEHNMCNIETIIKDEKNKQMVNDLVSEILGLEVKSVKFDSIKKFENISEYQFSTIKTICQLQDENKLDVFFKLIRKNKIKESIFCYWCLLYEDALNKQKEELTMATLINKVVISEIGMERYKNSVFLEIKDNKTDILKHGTEVHLVDFIKYIKLHQNERKNELKRWLDYIEEDSEDILMLEIVLNKDLGRSNIKIV